MKRLWIVVSVSLCMLLALFGVRNFDSSREPSDEILAYEVNDVSGVTVTLSGGIERVLINTWLLVPIDAREPQFPYGIEMVVTNLDGETIVTRRFETRSRLSDIEGDSTAQARVADAQSWVCEPRSFELETDALAGQAGLLRVRALPGVQSRVLLRMTHKAERGDLERRILERALGPEEMRRIMAGRSSLGFFDLPTQQRVEALSFWERRLTAQGSEGRDYQSRRLLIGKPTAPPRADRWLQSGVDTSPEQQVALNLNGALALRLHAEVGTAFWVKDGEEGASTRHVVSDPAGLDLQLPDNGLRTVTLYSEAPHRVALSAPTLQGWIPGEPPALIEERFEVLPDVRKRNHYRLDNQLPIVVSAAPEQPWIGLFVRGELVPNVTARPLEFKAVWKDDGGKFLGEVAYRAHSERSLFERLDSSPVTDYVTVRLRVPEGATRLEVRGDPSLVAAPFVAEPMVPVAVRSPPYDVEPPEGLAWRYSPLTLSPISGVRPDNLSELRAHGRELALYEQVRLEPLEGRGTQIVARVLQPIERTTERSLLSLVTPLGPAIAARAERGSSATSSFSSLPGGVNSWVLLSSADQGQRLRFVPATAGAGTGAAELEWTLLAPKQSLGEPWSLALDGQALVQQELAFTTARGNQLIASGEHRVALQAGPDVLVALRAKPLGSQLQAFKQQSVVHAPQRTGLTFPFTRGPGELLSVVVVLAVQGQSEHANLQYAIDHGEPKRHSSFFHRETEPGATLPVTFGAYGRGLIWDADNGGRGKSPDGLERIVIPLGDDLVLGKHALTLSVAGLRKDERAWLRVVVVGRKLDATHGGEVVTGPNPSSP